MEVEPRDVLAQLAEVGTLPSNDGGIAATRLSAGLECSLRRVDDETLPFIAGGGSELQFIFGPYGRGKTHYLKALEHSFRQRGFVTAYVDTQAPFRWLTDTYRAVASAMLPPRRVATALNDKGVAAVIGHKLQNGDGSDGGRSLVSRVKAAVPLAADFRNLVIAYAIEAAHSSGDDDLIDDLDALLTAARAQRVTLGPLYRRHPHVRRPLGKLGKRNAAAWLRSLLSLPHVLGYGGLVVLFDETETFLRGGPRQRQTHFMHVRTFVDHVATGTFRGCAVYYAVTDEFADAAGRDLPALSQRIERVNVNEIDARRNPRAVWVNIDELTDPAPDDPSLFSQLSERVVDIGLDAGLTDHAARAILARTEPLFAQQANSIQAGRVRDFVKFVATSVVDELIEPKEGRQLP